jgi:aspartyl protease family protein
VPAVVTPTPMPYVLLGSSALSRMRMQRETDVMRLQLR